MDKPNRAPQAVCRPNAQRAAPPVCGGKQPAARIGPGAAFMRVCCVPHYGDDSSIVFVYNGNSEKKSQQRLMQE